MTSGPSGCWACDAVVGDGASFCGACGAPVRALDAALDAQTLQHLVHGERGLLRVRLDNRGGALGDVELGLTLDAHALERQALGPLAAGAAALATVPWTPDAAGFYTLAGHVDADGTRWTLGPLHVRVGGERQPVSIVIDQSHARVVDNSRSSFGVAVGGGLLGEGEFVPLPIQRVAAPRAPTLPARPVLPPVRFSVVTPRAGYDFDATLARGDLATLYGGRDRGSGQAVVLKLADDRADNDLVQHEVDTLALLVADDAGDARSPTRHLPRVVDRMKTSDGRVGTVFERLDGIDLVELRRRLDARGEPGLAPRHVVWLLRRALTALGWAHARGVLHANLDPAHILVRASDHMVWLVDWCWSIVNPARTGQGWRAKNDVYSPPEVAQKKPPIPASDLFALGRCAWFALGGDPVGKTLPAGVEVPEPLLRFLRFMVVDSPRGRPQDAIQLYLQLDKLREQIWGPHTFVPLDL